jgi:hypothetical protein
MPTGKSTAILRDIVDGHANSCRQGPCSGPQENQGRKPRVFTTAKLRSFATDNHDLIRGIAHRPQEGPNNRASERRRSCNFPVGVKPL